MEPARFTSAYQLAFTDGTPYTFEPGAAASRSATSDWTMTRVRSMRREGVQHVQQHRHGDVVGEVGDQRGRRRGRAARATCIASVCTSAKRSARSRHPGRDGRGQRGGEHVVDLDGDDPVGGLQQRQGQRPEPGADLHDDVVGAYLGGAHDPADRVGVDDEVLAALLGGAYAQRCGQFADVGGAEEGVRGVRAPGRGLGRD